MKLGNEVMPFPCGKVLGGGVQGVMAGGGLGVMGEGVEVGDELNSVENRRKGLVWEEVQTDRSGKEQRQEHKWL